MLCIHFANRFESLSSQLVSALRPPVDQDTMASIWQEDVVVVPSAGVQRRLTLDMADALGICTQVRFTYLAQWLWSLMAQHLSGVAAQSPLDHGPLSWRVWRCLQDRVWVAQHPRLQSYLAHADPLMELELAEQVAQRLEAYATYRPLWGEQWQRGEIVLDPGQDPQHDEAWQAALWRRLSAQIGLGVGPGLGSEHPARTFTRLLNERSRSADRPEHLPPCVHLFALPSVPPLHLEVLQALATWMDVEIYAINPCQEYWFDVVNTRRLAWLATRRPATDLAHLEVGHPLLSGWGQATQAHMSLLVQACGDEVLDDAHFVDPVAGLSEPTLLEQLQSSILNLVAPQDWDFQWALEDRSLEVHVCHSLVRELEVLHDRLIGLFSQSEGLQLSDVAVMLPDLAAAAPWIEAVFGTCPPQRHIPYTITGLGRTQVNPYAQVLMDLLDFLPSRWTAHDLMALAQREPVARRFGWSNEDLDLIRSWLKDTGTHWGLNAQHRQQLGLPADPRHSIQSGLERSFVGWMLPQDCTSGLTDSGPWPLEHVQASQARTLGAWWAFVNTLTQIREQIQAPLLASAWPALLQEALTQITHHPASELEAWNEVRQALSGLGQEFQSASWSADGSELPMELPLELVKHRLKQCLDDTARGGVPHGTVTFTSLSSLRNLPYKVVCILQLNDGVFPSTPAAPEFDLLSRAPQAGDRQHRWDQRNLFLDALLSTRQTLHLSYTGRHVRDNTELPPSVLVSELIELLETSLTRSQTPLHPPAGDATHRSNNGSNIRQLIRQRLRVEHPLQSFSEAAFSPQQADPRVQSFRGEYAAALNLARTPCATPAFCATPVRALPDQWRSLQLQQLVDFLRHPARFFLEHRLGMQLPRRQLDLEEDEPWLAARRLPARWAQRLLEAFEPAQLTQLQASQVWPRLLCDPLTPSGPMGEAAFLAQWPALQGYAQTLEQLQKQDLCPQHEVRWSTEIDGVSWQLQGQWSDLRRGGWTRTRFDDFHVADVLEAWCHHLLLCTSPPEGVNMTTRWIGRDGGFVFKPCMEPSVHLEQALQAMAQGLSEPLPFFPRTAWAYAQSGYQRNAALGEWQVSPVRRFAESQDVACQWAWRGQPDPLSAHWSRFDALTREIFEPLLQHMEQT